jgi:glycosyltransferase involved in cell wall biosynthesis
MKKLIGITRVRNEAKIITNTLNHVANFVHSVIVYDDCSTDNTANICEQHDIVSMVIRGHSWDSTPQGRSLAEGSLRQMAYNQAVKQGADWVYCFDADEYLEFNPIPHPNNFDTLYFRLFDFYITPEDINHNYLKRQFMGCEYRDIPMMFKVSNSINFRARIPYGHGNNLGFGGYIKHYGKAISIEEWENTCKYYVNYRWKNMDEELLERWKKRIGKAVHTKSDFGTELITWEERKDEDKIIKIG